MLTSTRSGVSLALCTALALTGLPRAAAAADEGDEAPPKPAPAKHPAAKDTSNQLLGPVERLPDSAYPNTPVRGIPGGSLQLDESMNGLQWPYYPKTGIGVSGYAWIDTGYEKLHVGNTASNSLEYFVQQGRLALRVTPTWSDGEWFAQGQAIVVAEKDQSVSAPLSVNADDVWIRIGKWGVGDLTLGRFLGWQVYHPGMGLDLFTLEYNGATDPSTGDAPAFYGVTFGYYRPQNIGQAALHFYPTEYLRFELQGQFGNENAQNAWAVRPVGIFDVGWLKLKLAAEYKDLKPQQEGFKAENKEWGYGGSLQFVFDPTVEFGLNAAQGFVDVTDSQGVHDNTKSSATGSLGAFLNWQAVTNVVVGGGVNYTLETNQQFDSRLRRDEDFDHWQAFGAVQYRPWTALLIKAVYGYALANINHNNGGLVYFNTMQSFRVRFLLLF